MSLPDPDTTIGSYFGLAGDDVNNLATIQADLATLTSMHAADLVTLDGLISDLWADGIPTGPYSVGAYDGATVSVLRAPLAPVTLIDQGPAVVADLCALVATAIEALSSDESEILTALNLRAEQGPNLVSGNNPYPGT